jgi:hypothetical protein
MQCVSARVERPAGQDAFRRVAVDGPVVKREANRPHDMIDADADQDGEGDETAHPLQAGRATHHVSLSPLRRRPGPRIGQ